MTIELGDAGHPRHVHKRWTNQVLESDNNCSRCTMTMPVTGLNSLYSLKKTRYLRQGKGHGQRKWAVFTVLWLQ